MVEGGGRGLGVLTSHLTERGMTGNCSELCAEASCREGCHQQPLCSSFINTPVCPTLLFISKRA